MLPFGIAYMVFNNFDQYRRFDFPVITVYLAWKSEFQHSSYYEASQTVYLSVFRAHFQKKKKEFQSNYK